MGAYAFDHFSSTVRVWVRAVWRLPSGREITRTVSREVAREPDDPERALIVLDALIKEVEAVGHPFREGHGRLVEVLGTAHG